MALATVDIKFGEKCQNKSNNPGDQADLACLSCALRFISHWLWIDVVQVYRVKGYAVFITFTGGILNTYSGKSITF